MKSIYGFLAIVILICSCDAIQDPISVFSGNLPLFSTADFRIVTKILGETNTGRPNVTLVVKNAGTEIGYNVACNIQVKKGDIIIGSGFAYFAGGGDIKPGEKAQDDAVFWGLATIQDCVITYQLTWLER